MVWRRRDLKMKAVRVLTLPRVLSQRADVVVLSGLAQVFKNCLNKKATIFWGCIFYSVNSVAPQTALCVQLERWYEPLSCLKPLYCQARIFPNSTYIPMGTWWMMWRRISFVTNAVKILMSLNHSQDTRLFVSCLSLLAGPNVNMPWLFWIGRNNLDKISACRYNSWPK